MFARQQPTPRFGNSLALTEVMSVETEWRKLCALIENESDPERLSELVDQLIEALDSRRQALSRQQESLGSPTGEK
jgi:hypothetical protein